MFTDGALRRPRSVAYFLSLLKLYLVDPCGSLYFIMTDDNLAIGKPLAFFAITYFAVLFRGS